MPKVKAAVLVSGGLDSSFLLGEMADRYSAVYPIYIRQGLRWEKAELYWLKKFIQALHSSRVKPLTILDVPVSDVYGRHWSTHQKPVPGARSADKAVYLPGRNLMLISKASVLCAMHRVSVLAIGSLDHNPFPDATPAFFKQFEKLIQKGLRMPFRIDAPYRGLSKRTVFQRGVFRFPFYYTFSCLSPKGMRPCGRCNKCAERRKTFNEEFSFLGKLLKNIDHEARVH